MGLTSTREPTSPAPPRARARLGWALRLATLLLAVSFIAFALIAASPVDPVAANVGSTAYLNMSPEKRAQLALYWGRDEPLISRYLAWLGGIVQGDWGMSLRFNRPVTEVIAQRAANSALLLALAWVISGVVGFTLGVLAGVRRGTWIDRVIKGACLVLASTPAFWLGLVLLTVFAVYLGWFPFGLSRPIDGTDAGWADGLYHLVLPAATLSIVSIPPITLHTREKMIDVAATDSFRFARARGQSLAQATRRHGLRAVLLPALTLQFASLAEIFGGSVLVEQVFSYPGLGRATIEAGIGGDASLLAGITLVTAAAVFIGNAIANVLYGVIDPRIRRGSRHA